MTEQKVTPNGALQVTLITPCETDEKNQQGAHDSAKVEAQAGEGSRLSGGAQEPAPQALVRPLNHTLTRLLHEDGGGKSAVPPQFALRLSDFCEAGHTLALWAAKYLAIKVCGRSSNTVAAKARDLATFIEWFVQSRGGGDGAGEIGRWIERDTRRYLSYLEKAGRKPATINRALCTLRHFAGWAHGQPGGIFTAYGHPALEVPLLGTDEPECKKLEAEELNAVLAAARAAIITRPGRGPGSRYRPQRNLAILGVLLYTGMRISEALSLKRQQYDGASLHGVKCKGHRVRDIELHPECARLLDAYVEGERPWDNGDLGGAEDSAVPDAARPLFLNRQGGAISRHGVSDIFEHLAKAASEAMGGAQIHLHPHRLRHTFGALYREASESDTETAAALGHSSLRHVGRYVRKTRDERRDVLARAFLQHVDSASMPAP